MPNPGSPESLHEERRWLQRELTDWLDSEWRQAEPAAIHSEIGQRTGQVYERQRMEGENDLTSVMLAIGSELEGMDFSGAFVGPWNVANRAAELLLNNAAGERIRLKPYIPEEKEAWLSQPKDVTEDDVSSGKAEPDGKESEESENTWGAVSPSLADQFERLKFLRDVIDGSASKELVDGAIAAVMNFRYDVKHGTWDGSDVDDEFFRQFGDMPPDTLGSEDEAELTDTLKYLNAQLTSEIEKSEDLAASLDLVVETLNGSDLTEIQRADENDHKFRKREIVAKWLHLLGGF